MAARSSKREYDDFREASGWYAAAWRDYRRLSLQELADEIGSSRNHLNDMERGTKPWNAKWLAAMSEALGVRAGHIIDVNPFEASPEADAFLADFNKLDERGRKMVLASLQAASR